MNASFTRLHEPVMRTRHFNVFLEWDADAKVWGSYVPGLNSLATFGESREEAIVQTREAILGYLEAAAKEGIDVPAGDGMAELVDVDVALA